MSRLVLSALCLGLCGVAGASPPPTPAGTVLELRFLERLEPAQVSRAIARLYARAGLPDTPLAVERYRLRFSTPGLDGHPSSVAATLDVPVTPSSGRGRPPIYVFGPGTSGVADPCAPSRERPEVRTWGNYAANSLSYASAGFVTITPDYLYFDDPRRLQPYFVAQAEAQVMLDAARAVLDAVRRGKIRSNPAPAVFVGGYSQGGHAAFSAADFHRRYAPEIPLKGVLGFAATTDVAGLLRQSPQYAPFVLASYRQTYGPAIHPAKLLTARTARTLERDVQQLCVDDLAVYPRDPAQAYTPAFARALLGMQVGKFNPTLARALRDNEAGLHPSAQTIPAFVVQGAEDSIVSNAQQQRFFGKLCTLGRPVVYHQYAGVNHFQSRQFGFRDALAWMHARSRGGAAPSDCTR